MLLLLYRLVTLFTFICGPCTTAFAQASSVSSTTTTTTLDGYAFDCGGVLLGFQGMDQIVCLTGGKKVQCGNYIYSEFNRVLTGHTFLMGDFLAYSMDIEDSTLVSFQSDLGMSCHAVSLDWPNYSTSQFLGLKCPTQNMIPTQSYEDNHFSLGLSGDVALRSPLEFTSSGRRLVRDSYGIYQWNGNDESLRIYFGPQQGQPMTVLKGRLTHQGKLFVEGYVPPGPCVHDGASAIINATELPQHHLIASSTRMGTTAKNNPSDGSNSPSLEDGEMTFVSANSTERAIYWILLGISFFGLSALSSSC
eukprot:CAMPEP_0119012294 /NCGR_PEP_ID=MMETSP1176-20130426/6197_1 /TAXON_ID=265551 /ORGANISM="Synedropsis recta cf, Strain CCMP1620" /LENGTH=305 /DNA_ID=CAMNT_0006965221 /DNA_START=23 /DNA_END=940 /DNA_ORIENTATION=-